MDLPRRTDRPELRDAIEQRFGVRIHPAEFRLVFSGEEMVRLLVGKIDAAGLGRDWPESRIWRELRGLLAECFGDWPEDVLQHHPLRRDEYRA